MSLIGIKNENPILKMKNLLSPPPKNAIKVYVRIRPPLKCEIIPYIPFRSIALVTEDKNTISIVEYLGLSLYEDKKQLELVEEPNLFRYHMYTFDKIFDMNVTQEEVYKEVAFPAVKNIISGFNSTIFAYGQTGTGKTYTIEGLTYDKSSKNKGFLPRVIEDIFKYIQEIKERENNISIIVKVSYLQIYKESIDDLIVKENKNLLIRENKKKGVYVNNLSEWEIPNKEEIYKLLEKGENNRVKGAMKQNNNSSRSHAIFSIIIEQVNYNEGERQMRTGKLNLVDLAGSERAHSNGITGMLEIRMEESKKINKSLSALGNVIMALSDNKSKYVPFRDSKLTRLLANSIGGNCKTSMIATISPFEGNYNETISTLNFAKRAKKVNIKAKVNVEFYKNDLLFKYEEEIKLLRKEINELKNKNRKIYKDEQFKNENFSENNYEIEHSVNLNILPSKYSRNFKESYDGNTGDIQYNNLLDKQRNIITKLFDSIKTKDKIINYLKSKLIKYEKNNCVCNE